MFKSSKYKYYFAIMLFILISFALSKDEKITSKKEQENQWEISGKNFIFQQGEQKEVILTLYPKVIPPSNDSINFDDTIIIGIDLQKPDETFVSKIDNYQSTPDKETYHIIFTSNNIGKNSYTITLYDFENQNTFTLEKINFEVVDNSTEIIIPDFTQTKIIKRPPKTIGENDTISFEFQIYDTKGNVIENASEYLDYFTLINNNKDSSLANFSYDEEENVFKVSAFPSYLPLLQKINIHFDDGQIEDNIFLEDFDVYVILYPFYLNTQIEFGNMENITYKDTLQINISIYNYKNVSVTNDYSALFGIVVGGPLEDQENQIYQSFCVDKIDDLKLEYQNKYTITLNDEKQYTKAFFRPGNYIIIIVQDDIVLKEQMITIKTDGYSIDRFKLRYVDQQFNPNEIEVGTTFGFRITGRDSFGNKVPESLSNDIKISLFKKENNETKPEELKFKYEYQEDTPGELYIFLSCDTPGDFQLRLFFKNKEILVVNGNEKLPVFSFYINSCLSLNLNQNINENNQIYVGQKSNIYFYCLNRFNKQINKGGEIFTAKGLCISEEKYTSFDLDIIDNENGKYSFEIYPEYFGDYEINIYKNDELFKELKFKIEKDFCKGKKKPYLCPNKNICVDNILNCIDPASNCPDPTPFYCNVNNKKKCVFSQLECDCPENYTKCEYMQYCVPKNRKDMCPSFKTDETICKKFPKFSAMCLDGICRKSKNLSPTQRVCPIGKVLCADLSCRNNIHECFVSPLCEKNQIRCADQTCVDNQEDCPSTITCVGNKKYVCPDGACVDSEIECKRLPICPKEKSYLCQDNHCATEQKNCIKSVICGHKLTLCNDLICRASCENI